MPIASQNLYQGGGSRAISIYNDARSTVENMESSGLPDIMLIDIGLPDMSGVELTRIIKARYPEIVIIVISIFRNSDTVWEAIRAGASGYLCKSEIDMTAIMGIVMDTVRGGSFCTPAVTRILLDRIAAQEDCRDKPPDDFRFTNKETEIASDIAKGLSYKDIESKHHLSKGSVNSHVHNIYKKLRVNSKGEAIIKLRDAGY